MDDQSPKAILLSLWFKGLVSVEEWDCSAKSCEVLERRSGVPSILSYAILTTPSTCNSCSPPTNCCGTKLFKVLDHRLLHPAFHKSQPLLRFHRTSQPRMNQTHWAQAKPGFFIFRFQRDQSNEYTTYVYSLHKL